MKFCLGPILFLEENYWSPEGTGFCREAKLFGRGHRVWKTQGFAIVCLISHILNFPWKHFTFVLTDKSPYTAKEAYMNVVAEVLFWSRIRGLLTTPWRIALGQIEGSVASLVSDQFRWNQM